jgi:micrococcal nuclease
MVPDRPGIVPGPGTVIRMVRMRAVVVATALAATPVLTSVVGWRLGALHAAANPQARVVEVIDGDTVVVVLPDGRRDTVRILGVDTPETHHPTKGLQCFGREAAAFTRRRLLGRVVRLERDVEFRDLYGRRLAYVIVDGQRFDDVLLRKGYARLLVIRPNVAHARALLAAELDARHNHRGLWAAC